MELTLSPKIPTTRVINGHNVFNKGYHHGIRGKTYEEYYGEEIARKKRENMSKSLKGHRFWSNGNGASKKCVAIHNNSVVARFTSAKKATDVMNVDYATVRRWLKHKIKPKNGWVWYYEDDLEYINILNR